MGGVLLILFFGVALISELIGTIGGFGSATIFTAFGALLLNLKTVIALAAFLHLSGALVRGIYFFRHINWGIFGWFMLTDVLFTVVGASVIAYIPDPVARGVFGSFLIIYGLVVIFSNQKISLSPKKIFLFVGGAVSGFLAGLLGTGGAARSAALQIFKLPKASYLGTSAAMAVVTDILRIPIYLASGLLVFTEANLWLAGGLVAIAVVGAFAGSRLAEKIPERGFRIAVHILLLAVGVYFLVNSLS
ncbi:MAG: sulfite exporter TauE/SafE family protein [Candidatus Harrisonbacteria bacterium]|nr:sulfite exporter TauE/SafE family protein [Candidatus Harrisonbacteria bacterium]